MSSYYGKNKTLKQLICCVFYPKTFRRANIKKIINIEGVTMYVIGHRGASAHKEENTLPAFEMAFLEGADMIETDLRMSSDGRIVLCHDEAYRNRLVNESNLVDLKMLGPVAQISDVLRLLNGDMPINFEIKEPGVVEPLFHTLKKCMQYGWDTEHFLVSSFDHHALSHFKRLMPNVRIGALMEGIPLGYSDFASELGAYSVHLNYNFINQEFVNHAHANGMKVLAYTVNDFSVLDRMIALGVDGIFTDHPGEAVTYLKKEDTA